MSKSRIITLHQPKRLEIGAGASARVGTWAEGAERVFVVATPHTSGFVDRLGLTGAVTGFSVSPREPDITAFA